MTTDAFRLLDIETPYSNASCEPGSRWTFPNESAVLVPEDLIERESTPHPIQVLASADCFDVESHVANAIEITTIEFATKVLAAPTLAVVMFHEVWNAISARARRRLIFLDRDRCREPFVLYTMDIDRCARLGLRYGVTTLPTILLFREGRLVASCPDARDNDAIVELINSAA